MRESSMSCYENDYSKSEPRVECLRNAGAATLSGPLPCPDHGVHLTSRFSGFIQGCIFGKTCLVHNTIQINFKKSPSII
jgi:hypothetical protein